ncbi:MAG: DUF5671 domain-containing protein [Patescibacteria group bacterium]
MTSKNPTTKSTARDVFFYLLMIVTLYAAVISFITLLWQYINVQFPDPLEFYYTGAVQLMRGAISALVVVWPVFLFTSWFIKKDLLGEKQKQQTWVRRWLLYLTLFIASITIIIDLVTLTNSFLGGELTTRIVLKTLVILVVAITVFWFYLWELRRDAFLASKVHRIAAIVASVVIVSWIIAGFFIVGTPAQQRSIRFDEQRLMDIQELQSEVITFWQRTKRLPENLTQLQQGSYRAYNDPLTNEPYQYEVTGDLDFKLCVTFATASSKSSEFKMRYSMPIYDPYGYPIKGAMESWDHEAGYICFERTIDPLIYSQTLNRGTDERTPLAVDNAQALADVIIVSSPQPGDIITSPLKISGTARGNWYFEATAPAELLDWEGNLIAQGFVTAQGDWMTEDFVPFTGELTFIFPQSVEQEGTLILRNDNPSGLAENDQTIEVPVNFR